MSTPTPSTGTFFASSHAETATRRELDQRRTNGIEVTLSWAPDTNLLFVTVLNDADDSFELVVEAHEALDAFHHPVCLRDLPWARTSAGHRVSPPHVATALHVFDEATLHREPGTTIADHLTGAGAMLTVLAVAAIVFPRLRAGRRATFALFLECRLSVLLAKGRRLDSGAWQHPSRPAPSPS